MAPIRPRVTTAAVCVYPSRVADAVKSLKAANSSLPVASVATGFPAGQTSLKTRLEEVRMAVEDGAMEIDIVINRTLALTGQWEAVYDEVCQFREACGEAHMKSILAIGELGTYTNVYKASLVAMMAGECSLSHTHTYTQGGITCT
ncbi:deoxyribose-phosphate aldolase [Salvelinus sp. IW2-2015]|uniref:deoxyribose-phosphate aldolase n=1 Tax=Salvelinus sp. IW2-2015 TaxID=2691554 RepID=UPI0038D4FD55